MPFEDRLIKFLKEEGYLIFEDNSELNEYLEKLRHNGKLFIILGDEILDNEKDYIDICFSSKNEALAMLEQMKIEREFSEGRK